MQWNIIQPQRRIKFFHSQVIFHSQELDSIMLSEVRSQAQKNKGIYIYMCFQKWNSSNSSTGRRKRRKEYKTVNNTEMHHIRVGIRHNKMP
jgi:hypothetical protein